MRYEPGKNYFREIEEIFLELSDRVFGVRARILLSPNDIDMIRKCELAKIPPKIIRIGIEESLRTHRSNWPHATESPPLSYCMPAIRRNMKDYRLAHTGDR